MKKVSVVYVGETKIKANLRDKDTGAMLPESTVTVPPPIKKYRVFDEDLQRFVEFTAEFFLEGKQYVAHGVPLPLAETLKKSPNFEILKTDSKKPPVSAKSSVDMMEVKFTKEKQLFSKNYQIGETDSFKTVTAKSLIAEKVAVAV